MKNIKIENLLTFTLIEVHNQNKYKLNKKEILMNKF